MYLDCVNLPQFRKGEKVISIAYHPPEIMPGTNATIVSPWAGTLCAVQLPNGELHRWFASFELKPIDSSSLVVGEYATVITGHPPHVNAGTIVRIVKCISHATFYDVLLNGTKYHRWLAEFEIAQPIHQ